MEMRDGDRIVGRRSHRGFCRGVPSLVSCRSEGQMRRDNRRYFGRRAKRRARRIKAPKVASMRHDGGGHAMLALRRAKKAADEAAMAEAMLRRPPGRSYV